MSSSGLIPSPTSKKSYKSWNKDNIAGGLLSIDIIVDWLSTGNNYARWRGDMTLLVYVSTTPSIDNLIRKLGKITK